MKSFFGKSLVILAIMIGLGGCGTRVLVQPKADMGYYNRVAVLPFETDSFLSTVGYQLADEILVQLLETTPALQMVERTQIEALLQEQTMVRSGYMSMESAIQVGRLLGVRAIVTGSVTIAIGDVRSSPLNAQRVATGVATIRFIDTQTGKIIWAKRETAEYGSFKSVEGSTFYNYKTDHEIVQEVIQTLGKLLARNFYPHYELQ
ncbi:CsgG/HfaB family protein [bacterium]|nr:CsgG/HfaB family protein [bacterium]